MADSLRSVVVVNRRSIPVEGMFDGQVIRFEPGERVPYPGNIAHALAADSMLRLNLATGVTEVYALGIEGNPAFPCDPFQDNLASENPVELLDRRDVTRLTETEPKALSAAGVTGLGLGKNLKTVAPLPGTQESPFEGEGPIGGSNPDRVVEPAAEEDVQAVPFHNPDIRRGSQMRGRAEHRVNVKPQ